MKKAKAIENKLVINGKSPFAKTTAHRNIYPVI